MIELDSVQSKAYTEITQNLLTIQDPSKKQVKEEIIKICTKYSLDRIPKIMKYYQWQKNQILIN